MKNDKKAKRKNSNGTAIKLGGAALFFISIAFAIQIAVLVYERIRIRTDDKALIAVLLLIVILILSTVCVVIDWFRRKITVERPTNDILNATRKIASGDFNVRLDITREYSKYNEYDFIKENLNAMAAELKKNEVLKMDFISNLSHEIKTPLAVIQNGAELLKSKTLSDIEREEISQTLISASKRVGGLVGNVLKLNKLENQELQEKKERFNLTDALSDIIAEYEAKARQKGVTLDCDFEDLTVLSSKELLEIVWSNLLSNAVKFTPEGGQVTVTLKKQGENAHVVVRDTGIGMSPEIGERIFEKFYQCDCSHKQEGNGLGLALVKKVIGVLGGEISVNSELGKGSEFSVLLTGCSCEVAD